MILVTGATGFIGSYLCRLLIAKDIPFKALKRASSVIDPELMDQVEWVEGDVLDVPSLEVALDGVHTIFHNAAVISFYRKEYDSMDAININGTSNMINIALKKGVKRFVHMSSIAAIGKVVKTAILNENSQWVKSSNQSHYAETKYYSELEVWRGQEEGLSTIILNPSVVLGPGDWETGSTKMFKYVWDKGLFYPEGTFNYIDVRDLVKATVRLAESKVEGERYIVNAGKISYKSFFTMVANAFNKKAPTRKITPLISELAIAGERLRSMVTRRPPVITRETIMLSTIDYSYDGFKIKKMLDFDFNPIEDTIAWTCNELNEIHLKK